MPTKFSISLSFSEKERLLTIITKGQSPAYRIKHAHILLNADENGPNKTDKEVAEFVKCHPRTVFNVRKRYHEQGLEKTLGRKVRENPPTEPIIDGFKEAKLIAIACSKPPNGYSRWTCKLLSEKMVELEIVEKISPKTVERALKKRTQTSLKEMLGNSSKAKR
jgi:hypothetical protein